MCPRCEPTASVYNRFASSASTARRRRVGVTARYIPESAAYQARRAARAASSPGTVSVHFWLISAGKVPSMKYFHCVVVVMWCEWRERRRPPRALLCQSCCSSRAHCPLYCTCVGVRVASPSTPSVEGRLADYDLAARARVRTTKQRLCEHRTAAVLVLVMVLT